MAEYVLGIDDGTESIRTSIYKQAGRYPVLSWRSPP